MSRFIFDQPKNNYCHDQIQISLQSLHAIGEHQTKTIMSALLVIDTYATASMHVIYNLHTKIVLNKNLF